MPRSEFTNDRMAEFWADKHAALGVVFAVNALTWDVVLADGKSETPEENGAEFFVIEVGKHGLGWVAVDFAIAFPPT